MTFQIHALPDDEFRNLFALPEEALHARGIRRVIADGRPAYPCRVSLEDAGEGERLLLLPYAHHRVDSPYRGSGPVYVREHARQAHPARDEIPGLLRTRILSLRGYDANGMMLCADVAPGTDAESAIAQSFALQRVAYLHIHYAKPGCYACRVERA
jgi:hypothetical protein